MEEWRDVIGYEEYFQVSNLGRIYSKRTSKILKQTICKTGYYTVATKIGGRNGKSLCFKVHRLVAEAFIYNLENKPFVNHKDGNKLNNSQENLEWCTQSENVLHALEIGLLKPLKMEDSPSAKLNVDLVNAIRLEYKETKTTHRKLAEKYGVGKTTIQNILAGERWNNSV